MVHSCFTHITTWDSKQLELRIQATSMGKCSTNRSDVQRIGKRDAGNHVFFVPHTKVFLQCYFILFLCFNGVSLNMVPWLCVDNASSTATNVWPWETGNHSHFGGRNAGHNVVKALKSDVLTCRRNMKKPRLRLCNQHPNGRVVPTKHCWGPVRY